MSSEPASEQSVLVLVGIEGWVTGEVFILKDQETVVIGRSRSCDISFRRIGAYLALPPNERDADHEFNTVSRRHLRFTITGYQVKVEDLSTNGSYWNGDAITQSIEVSAADSENIFRLGTRETMQLELASPERLAHLRAEAGDHAAINRHLSNENAPQSDNDSAEATQANRPDNADHDSSVLS